LNIQLNQTYAEGIMMQVQVVCAIHSKEPGMNKIECAEKMFRRVPGKRHFIDGYRGIRCYGPAIEFGCRDSTPD